MSLKVMLLLVLVGCSSMKKNTAPAPVVKEEPKEFSRGELILGTQLLTKIFDEDMAPLACVPGHDEAELLLRTIRPRMEVVEDDIEASLDQPSEVQKLIDTCDQSCTCGYVDDLLREHLVNLNRSQRKELNAKKTEKELSRCLNFAAATFCQGELYKELNKEKVDFTFDETSP